MTPVQEIKEKLDIVEFVRSYITLLPAGKNFKANCPFHKEKTPSFMVSPERQTWHCFGSCNEGGDIFKFLMKYENIEFYEALKILAEKVGIELKKLSPSDQKQFGILYDINNSAKDFFKKELWANRAALDYLKQRGLKEETVKEFELGFAPLSFDALTLYLLGVGYDVKDIERAGLNFKSERGSYVDRFRSRVMFPIYNNFGKVVGFSGRVFEQPGFNHEQATSVGKYINSPETPIFNKSRILYGFHKAKNFIREMKKAVLVEGQMDFLMSWQDGVKNVVATSGTALTIDHLKTLKRQTDDIVFCFDNDEAGLKAAERSIDLANSIDLNSNILVLKDFKDPAEAVEKSPGLLMKLIEDARPAIDFYFTYYLGGVDSENISEFKKGIRVILGKIKKLVSAVERAHWLREFSLKTKINENVLMEEMDKIGNEKKINSNEYGAISNNEQKESNILSRRELIAHRLLSLLIIKETFKSQISEYIEYLPDDYVLIAKHLIEEIKLEEDRLISLLNLISLRSSFEIQVLDDEKIEHEFNTLLRELKLEFFKERREKLVELIKEAERKGDEDSVASILKEFDEVSKLMHN